MRIKATFPTLSMTSSWLISRTTHSGRAVVLLPLHNCSRSTLKSGGGRRGFAKLEDDGYIHQQLLMQVHAADNMELLAACCEYWYTSALLDSCKRYQSFVSKEVRYDSCTLNILYMCLHVCTGCNIIIVMNNHTLYITQNQITQ